MYNLLNELPEIFDCKYGHAHRSSTLQDFPYSDIFDTTEVISSFRLMCLTFSAIDPIAWAAATLVSQFLLRKY